MDSVSRYLVSPIVDRGANNDKASGGLPHSEITGSKPIPGSPVLIAGYHVLHRLLLPRHPPNALLALDPIQRAQGRPFATRPTAGATPHGATGPLSTEVIHVCAPPTPEGTTRQRLVYLTWNKAARGPPTRLQARRPDPPLTRGGQAASMFSLHDVIVLVGRESAPRALADPATGGVVEPGGIEPPTPCLQSRCSPS